MPRHSAHRLDHLAHAETLAVTEVVDEAVFLLQRIENQQMSICQIAHVNVIADAGAVRCRIVVSENGELLPRAERHLKRQRN